MIRGMRMSVPEGYIGAAMLVRMDSDKNRQGDGKGSSLGER